MPRARQPDQLLAGVTSSVETWSPLVVQVSEGRDMVNDQGERDRGLYRPILKIWDSALTIPGRAAFFFPQWPA